MRALPLRGQVVLGQFGGSGAIGLLGFFKKYYLWGARGGAKMRKKMGLGKINPDEARCWPVSLSRSPGIKAVSKSRALASHKIFRTK